MDITLIDGDLIVYEAAFCVERKEKQKEYLNWYQVSKIVDTIVRKILRKSEATHYLGFLTDGKSNFRLQVATTLPYKGQRKTNADKPKFYDEIRHYLMKNYGFQMMRGVEADDALTIVSEYFKGKPKVRTRIATKDKDLWQYPGRHYNMNTKENMIVTPAQAHRNLWKQMILGDMSTDNIPGLSHAAKWEIPFRDEQHEKAFRPIPCHQYGEVTANLILDDNRPEDYPKVIYELYLDAYDDPDCKDSFGDYRFHETFQLVYMLRKPPKNLQITYEPIKVKVMPTESEDFQGYRPKLEF